MRLVDPLRWPDGGVPADAVREIRRVKARVEAERLPRGKDPKRNVKLGPGGLADVEWTVQLLQLLHAGAHPRCRRPERSPRSRPRPISAWSTPTRRARSGRRGCSRRGCGTRSCWPAAEPSNTLPTDVRALDRVARLVGYGPGESGRLVEDHLRTIRRARAVVDRVFYA